MRMMKKFTLMVFLLALVFKSYPQKSDLKLTKAQIDQIERGYGMFIHFGINTFNEVEWSNGGLPASSYNPTDLDCDQWIKIAKETGFRYVILVTKHHDGFCLWDSKYTEYDVASSPIKIDVVKEVAKACKKYGIKLGLYYSLWDRHESSYKSQEYHKYMKNQLTELMTNYGDICELWFDGGWDKKDNEWELENIYNYVKKMQPNCLITVNHTIGLLKNKKQTILKPAQYKKGDTIRYFPVDFRIKDPNLARWDDPKYYTYKGKLHYLPFEHTICLSDRWNWFQKSKTLPARPVDELEELFYWCTANDNVLIINLPPDQRGRIRENERIRLLELADRLGIRDGKKPLPSGPINLSFNKPIDASSSLDGYSASKANDMDLESYWLANDSKASLEIDFQEEIQFDRITLFEKADMTALGDGFSNMRNFKIKEYELKVFSNNKWVTFYKGDYIQACKIINLPLILKGSKIQLNILDSEGNPGICHFAVSLNSTKGKRAIQVK